MTDQRLHQSRFLKACRGEPVDTTPIWLMRQAGRYMKEYQEVRAKVSLLELCHSAELACEVTVTAQRRLGVDAAILFADLLPILEPMGLALEYQEKTGPVLTPPVRDARDVERLREHDPRETMPFVSGAIRLTRRELASDIPLIGFSGMPFTLAAYAIEGRGSRNFEHAKTFMYRDGGAWRALCEKLARTIVRYINAQIDAGAQAIQLFDSWVGCLSPHDYREYALPYSRAVIEGIGGRVPVIHFGVDTATLLPQMREAGGDVMGFDWRTPIGETWARLGCRAVQGNLDPLVLFADRATVERKAQAVLDDAGERPGHIFNLGHGILPGTPVDNVVALVDYVHQASERRTP